MTKANKKPRVTIVLLTLLCSAASGQNIQIAPVSTAADLDLSGDIMYAISFGDDGNPTVAGVVFSEDQDCSAVSREVLGEGPATWWGPNPETGDAGLNHLLGGLAYKWGTPPLEISFHVNGLTVGSTYLLQLLGYEPSSDSRNIDVIVNDEQIVTGLNPLAEQGGVAGHGGLAIKYRFTAVAPILDIRFVSHWNACALSGLVLTHLPAARFADYGSGTTLELVSGRGLWQINWGQGPWTWSDGTDVPLLDSNVTSILDLHTTGPADVSAEVMATLPIAGTLTLSAHDPTNKDVVIGTMVLSGSGVNVIDGNASRVIVDEGSGMFLTPFHPPGPELTLGVDEATGVFAYIQQVGNWTMQLAGSYAVPLIPGTELQDNVFTALGGAVPLIGGVGTFSLAGQYEAVESKMPQHFCEFGTGVALEFGAAGGRWDQVWGGGPWDWLGCPAEINATFLGDDVTGELTTTTTSAPVIDANMVLSLELAGQIRLVDHNETTPDQIDGQIVGDMAGTFVGDANAEHATFDADGNIVLPFGYAVHAAPDAMITVTEATGTFADIRQAGQWAWYVSGDMTLARLPDVPLQQNILAALEQPELILGAREQFVLTGWYYRDSE